MESLLLGLTMGVAAGISPGPLLVLVIVQTLRSGLRAGVVTAFAPLLSDAIVVAVTLLVLSRLPGWVLPAIGIVGSGYLIWLAWETWRDAGKPVAVDAVEPLSSAAALRRAVTVNLTSPHPWLSWATVLGPILLGIAAASPSLAVVFVVGFYATLVGAKIVLAVVVARSRRVIAGDYYLWTMRIAAVALAVLALVLMGESVLQLAA